MNVDATQVVLGCYLGISTYISDITGLEQPSERAAKSARPVRTPSVRGFLFNKNLHICKKVLY